ATGKPGRSVALRGDPPLEETPDPLSQGPLVPIIDNDLIGAPALLPEVHLGRLATMKLGGIPAPPRLHALDAGLQRGVNEDPLVALTVDVGLEQQRGVDDQSRGSLPSRTYQLAQPGPVHDRVDDLLQLLAGVGEAEDDAGDHSAVDLACLAQN